MFGSIGFDLKYGFFKLIYEFFEGFGNQDHSVSRSKISYEQNDKC